MKFLTIVSLIFVASFFGSVTSDRILFLLPIASTSHVNVFHPLIQALGERGHDIVSLSPATSSKMPKNVQQIQIMTVEEIFGELGNPFEMRKMGSINTLINGSFDTMMRSCEKLVRTDTFQNLVMKEKFDLVVVDILMNYCVLGAVPLIGAPSILVTTFAAPTTQSVDFGNRLPPSFVVDIFLDLSHRMSFLQRMKNVVAGSLTTLLAETLFLKKGERTYQDNLPNGKELPGVHEIQANSSMLFMNSHFTLNYPRPLLPDVIEVGGMHCGPPKPLPKVFHFAPELNWEFL